MRFMMLMIPDGYATAEPNAPLDPTRFDAMMQYNEELKAAGILEALDGLHPPSMGARVSFKTGQPIVTDGPFAESKEVLGGYWVINVATLAEAIDWASRCPGSPTETIEIRQIMAFDDWSEDVQAVAEKYPDIKSRIT